MGHSLRLIILAALAAFLAGCPGFDDRGPADVQGTWSGMLTPANGGAPVPITAAILDSNHAFIYTADGALFAVVGLESQRSVMGAMLVVGQGPQACPLNFGTCDGRFGFNGTAYQDQIELSARVSPGLPELPNTTNPQVFAVQLTRTTPYSTTPIPPFPIHDGQWQGYYLPSDLAVSLTVKAPDAFTGSDAYGCALTGSLQQLGFGVVGIGQQSQIQNLFKVTLNGAFGTLSGKCDADLIGVGYLSSTGTGPFKGVPGTYFFMGVYSPDAFGEVLELNFDTGYLAEFKVQ